MAHNPHLADEMNVSEYNRYLIDRVHEALYQQFRFLSNNFDSIPKNMLRVHAQRVQNMEYYLQELWGFEKDELRHTWWYKMPYCTCPKMDNADMYKIGNIVRGDCPYHGLGEK